MRDIEWHETNENNDEIKTIAMYGDNRIVGYNGILKGDKVLYKGEEYTVVMVSRLGDFGLSKTGELPYILRACPKGVARK
ncbi:MULTISPECIES: hypothetical protein [Bacillus cereus group]|uniref:hypothetical protein n=1 Tax=Bacillus cereus group TaxID=86661 RepID=UPI0022E6EAC2|nr:MULTISPECIES: hypothetical protein [unclassified Bacillus cereus group]MDA2665144.1 hypothetical protein [Bacillus cereus group sp. Bc032]MDA2675899.1 hypothetical protein [Bacillus cereus group sp. Bc031]MDA2681382.1 hypothetical protein [Bacillus cereus group sp. Bc029]MDA2686838.1 hypothetical protein [Bacillus cereus group sp. Bc030]MDA2742358.1 hypothetical protein [Bacillus cereus group sp. Bc011]